MNAQKVGGSQGTYYSNPGEVVIWKRCPKDFDFYVMDDDFDAGVMQMPDGTGLYLSTAAKGNFWTFFFRNQKYFRNFWNSFDLFPAVKNSFLDFEFLYYSFRLYLIYDMKTVEKK